MDSITTELSFLESLQTLGESELRAVIERANALLVTRRSERQDHALAEIRRLAKEHGLDVAARKRRGKRGRPRKTATAA
jgi:hypothetical protein